FHTVVNALNNHMSKWIKFFIQREETEKIKWQFWDITRFPGVIGTINDTHIAIRLPQTERKRLFINRKLYHSLNVMSKVKLFTSEWYVQKVKKLKFRENLHN
ncbi:hypothetical protein ALC57_11677, partial [Trachymyrmex cornetzi]